jgi:hypothetical protein
MDSVGVVTLEQHLAVERYELWLNMAIEEPARIRAADGR